MRTVCQPKNQAKEEPGVDKKTLVHTIWNCKNHVVYVPKYGQQIIYGKIKQDVGRILGTLCERKVVKIVEATTRQNHEHMYVEIPSDIMGWLKGKSSLMIFDWHAKLKDKYENRGFWCREYYVETVGGMRKDRRICMQPAARGRIEWSDRTVQILCCVYGWDGKERQGKGRFSGGPWIHAVGRLFTGF